METVALTGLLPAPRRGRIAVVLHRSGSDTCLFDDLVVRQRSKKSVLDGGTEVNFNEHRGAVMPAVKGGIIRR